MTILRHVRETPAARFKPLLQNGFVDFAKKVAASDFGGFCGAVFNGGMSSKTGLCRFAGWDERCWRRGGVLGLKNARFGRRNASGGAARAAVDGRTGARHCVREYRKRRFSRGWPCGPLANHLHDLLAGG